MIGSSQALFGVIGEFQLGALQLSAVVSQKKSKTEVKDYSGGAVDQEFNLKVWDYSDNHYFLDTAYKASFLDYFNSTSISQTTSDLSVDAIHLKFGFRRMSLLPDTEEQGCMWILVRFRRRQESMPTL
ncbi:MAG: hypothetical protein R2942_13105 [Ignavibacteria bacterium]